MEIYLLIGVVVSAFNYKALARFLDYWSSTHIAPGLKYNKDDYEVLTTAAYIGSAWWSLLLIPFWPISLIVRIWLIRN